eukprot:TRINITY_DN96733_c0_g1_i1.p1 TRINITY_DN96733_c0_g1~~TRINITY_DN96733_c0_g1_i1.p1  ORF type:complete len:365 (-),score=53.11 TRINITY_DN96733_c0_g1_i1:162-1256(-)
MRPAMARPLRHIRCAFWATVTLAWLSLHVPSIVGFAGALTRRGKLHPVHYSGSLLRAVTSGASAESLQNKPLNVGDYVVLASDCERFDDAVDGPLKSGDVGQIVKYDEDRPKPLTVEFEGRTWCYMLGALVKAPPVQFEGSTERQEAVTKQLLEACKATSRGQSGTEEERQSTLELIQALEDLNPTPRPSEHAKLLEGTWSLRFASEDVTRSSPFFWGWRKMLAGVPDPSPITRMLFGTEQLSETIFAVTDSIPIKTIGEARQTLSAGVLVNQLELKIAGVGQTFMTTTCQYVQAGRDGDTLALTVQTTQPSESTVPFADALVFPSEALLGKSAAVTMRVTYLDEQIRVVRNADDQVFVYSRIG